MTSRGYESPERSIESDDDQNFVIRKIDDVKRPTWKSRAHTERITHHVESYRRSTSPRRSSEPKRDMDFWLKAMKENYESQKEMLAQMATLMEGVQKLTENLLQVEKTRSRREFEPENTHLEENRRGPKQYITQRKPEWQAGPKARCYRCNKGGHMASECPLANYGLWFCYICQAEVRHKGTECPNKSGSSNRRDHSTNSEWRPRTKRPRSEFLD